MSFSIISVALISYTAISRIVFNNFAQLSYQVAAQQAQSMELYMKLIEESSNLIPYYVKLFDGSDNQAYNSNIPQLLDRILCSNTHILGVSLYNSNGVVYTSNNISLIPTFEKLETNQSFNDFVHSNQNSKWYIRNEDLSNFYITSNYIHKKMGLFTLTYKIFNNNHLTGYVLIDTDIVQLFDFFSNDGYKFFRNNNTYIATLNNILEASYNHPCEASLLDFIHENKSIGDNHLLSQDKNYLLSFSKMPDSDNTIITALPMTQIYSEFHLIAIILSLLSSLLLILTLMLNGVILKSITISLSNLYNRMKDPIQTS